MIYPPEPLINDEARNDTHMAYTGVRLYKRTLRAATSKKETIVMHQKVS